jgi:hypothetical protein
MHYGRQKKKMFVKLSVFFNYTAVVAERMSANEYSDACHSRSVFILESDMV